MSRGLRFRSERGCSEFAILGWGVLVVLGIVLVWYGFLGPAGDDELPAEVQPSVTLSATPVSSSTSPTSPSSSPTLPPTHTPSPTFTPVPTAILATPISTVPKMVAGEDGVNVRIGPDTNYARVGYLDPDAEARVTGRYGDWWQIEYEDGNGWVFGGIVTATNTDGVPEVEPSPSPTPLPPTVTPTPIPAATPTPEPPAGPPPEFRGLVPNSYVVEGAPGPYDENEAIWFNMDISNSTTAQIDYEALGTWVQETGQFQKSWKNREFEAWQHFQWRDHIDIPDAGTYNLWMTICYRDGQCANLMGPVTVEVQ